MPRAVLYLDDDPAIRWLTARAWQKECPGGQFATVATVAEAIAHLDAHAQEPAPVLVMDWRLNAAVEGAELVRLIRARSRDLPIVVVSAIADPAMVDAALEAGANRFIEKQLNAHTFAHQLCAAVAELSPKV